METKLNYFEERNRPYAGFEFSYPSKPSWKNYGSGNATVRITAEPDGSLYLICKESAEPSDKAGKWVQKETYTSIPPALIEQLERVIEDAKKLRNNRKP